MAAKQRKPKASSIEKLVMFKPKIKRTFRKDHILWLKQSYAGDVHESPKVFNKAYADILRLMADEVEKVKNAWADPEVLVWFYPDGEVSAEIMLSDPI